jgi:hypothetical protein
MSIYVRLWEQLAEFFSEWGTFQTTIVEKIKTHVLFTITFFLNRAVFLGNVEKYDRDRAQVTI